MAVTTVGTYFSGRYGLLPLCFALKESKAVSFFIINYAQSLVPVRILRIFQGETATYYIKSNANV